MNNLILLPTIHTTEERIQNQIDMFKSMFISQEGDIETCEQLIGIVINYLAEFDDDNIMLNQAYVKLQEANFWLDSSLGY